MAGDNVISLFADARLNFKINEVDISIERLGTFLDAAVLDYEVDGDGDIYIKEGFDCPLWISIDHDARFARLYTYKTSENNDMGWVNSLNLQYRIAQFSMSGDRIQAYYYLPIRNGFDVRHLISVTRLFSTICRTAFSQLDKLATDAEQKAPH